MKTWRIAWSGERSENGFKKWATERSLRANLEKYDNDVLDQRSIVAVLRIQKFSNSALYVINNKVIALGTRKIKDYYPLCFQRLLKLPPSRISATSGNTSDVNPYFYSHSYDYLY